jgi:hypothetical protein
VIAATHTSEKTGFYGIEAITLTFLLKKEDAKDFN